MMTICVSRAKTWQSGAGPLAATLKRAQAETEPSPLAAAKLRAEANGLEILATRLRDPAACGLPELRIGQGGEVTPLPDPRMPLCIRDVADTVQRPRTRWLPRAEPR